MASMRHRLEQYYPGSVSKGCFADLIQGNLEENLLSLLPVRAGVTRGSILGQLDELSELEE